MSSTSKENKKTGKQQGFVAKAKDLFMSSASGDELNEHRPSTASKLSESQQASSTVSTRPPPGIEFGRLQSNRSQYSIGSVSACTIVAAEASLRLLSYDEVGQLPKPSVRLLDEILDTCSNVSCDHLSFDDVLRSVERFSKGFRLISESQVLLNDIGTALRSIDYKNLHNIPFAVLITKPPESIAVVVQAVNRVILFDSHKRNHTDGAYLSIHSSILTALKEIEVLWPVTESDSGASSSHYEMAINSVNFFVVDRSPVAFSQLPSLNILNVLHNELTAKVAELSKVVADQSRQMEQMARELATCQNEVGALRARDGYLQTALATFLGHFLSIQASTAAHEQTALSKLAEDFKLSALMPQPLTPVVSPQVSQNGASSSPDRFRCVGCKKEMSIEFVFSMSNCPHQMCRPCAHAYITKKIDKRSFPIRCPVCDKVMDAGDIEIVLDEEEQRIFMSYAREQRDRPF